MQPLTLPRLGARSSLTRPQAWAGAGPAPAAAAAAARRAAHAAPRGAEPRRAGPEREQPQQQQQQQQQQPAAAADAAPSTSGRPAPRRTARAAAAAAAAAAAGLASAPGARALELIAEPANALSLPTWIIHVSSGARRGCARTPPPAAPVAVADGARAGTPPARPPPTPRPCPRPSPQTHPLHPVAEWVIAIALFWRYAEVTGNPRWKGMSWAMLPALGSAMSACTWCAGAGRKRGRARACGSARSRGSSQGVAASRHAPSRHAPSRHPLSPPLASAPPPRHLFYNSLELDFLVAIQAGLTVVGNVTCWIAAYRIYTAAKAEQGA
jgi:hypothetical protein